MHYCETSDGIKVPCMCSTGKDHDEAHFDGAEPED